MKIICDTREQQPLEFAHEFITEVKREKLLVGDYQAEFEDGYRPPICFERKGIGDLYGTLTSGYKRFKKEILRAQENKITLIIIIECTFTKVLGGYSHSTIEGITIIRTLFTLWVKYGIKPVFCKDREEASHYITEFFCALGRQHIESK
jgi:ERCC4-type nuclease